MEPTASTSASCSASASGTPWGSNNRNKNSKISKEWFGSTIKILRAMQDTIYNLYSDACPNLEQSNPYETEFGSLELSEIQNKDVYRRYDLLKDRLEDLAEQLTNHLNEALTATKPLPTQSLLNIIGKMIFLNPVDLVNSKSSVPKENAHLATLLPSIHCSALRLLSALMQSSGTNLLTEASVIENLSVREFKWISKSSQEYAKVKIALYNVLSAWCDISKGFVTAEKILASWVEQIRLDSQVEKNMVELNKPSTSKFRKGIRIRGSSQNVSGILTSDKVTKQKNSDLCSAALDLLKVIIPTLDKDSHRVAYELIAKTIIKFSQESLAPSPYDSQHCRVKMFQCALSLVLNPHPRSPISLGILTNLCEQSLTDSSSIVIRTCKELLSTLERVVHPVAPPITFPPVLVESASPSKHENMESDMDLETETTEVSCQTEEPILASNRDFLGLGLETAKADITQFVTTSNLKGIVKKSVQEAFQSYASAILPRSSNIPNNMLNNHMKIADDSPPASDSGYQEDQYQKSCTSPSTMTNGFSKRKAGDDSGNNEANKTSSNGPENSLKKFKPNDNDDDDDVQIIGTVEYNENDYVTETDEDEEVDGEEVENGKEKVENEEEKIKNEEEKVENEEEDENESSETQEMVITTAEVVLGVDGLPEPDLLPMLNDFVDRSPEAPDTNSIVIVDQEMDSVVDPELNSIVEPENNSN